MSTEAQLHDLSIWLLTDAPPPERNPTALYAATRAPRSRDAARRALDTIAALLTGGEGTADRLAWHLLRDDQVSRIRAALHDRHPASEANRMLAALRGVLTQCRRLGLTSDDAYTRAHAAATTGPRVSRGELRSVFESCAEDRAHPVDRPSAVRTLLYGNGVKDDQTAVRGETDAPDRAPQGEATAAGGQRAAVSYSAGPSAMALVPLHLRRAAPREAIAHALWEAGACLRSSAFCACLAMLRKALDLWSREYGARYGGRGGPGGESFERLDTRLAKIADENKVYRDAILTILDALGGEDERTGTDPVVPGDLASYGGIVCRGGHASSYDGYAVSRIKETYRNLHEQVTTLIAATTPELPL